MMINDRKLPEAKDAHSSVVLVVGVVVVVVVDDVVGRGLLANKLSASTACCYNVFDKWTFSKWPTYQKYIIARCAPRRPEWRPRRSSTRTGRVARRVASRHIPGGLSSIHLSSYFSITARCSHPVPSDRPTDQPTESGWSQSSGRGE